MAVGGRLDGRSWPRPGSGSLRRRKERRKRREGHWTSPLFFDGGGGMVLASRHPDFALTRLVSAGVKPEGRESPKPSSPTSEDRDGKPVKSPQRRRLFRDRPDRRGCQAGSEGRTTHTPTPSYEDQTSDLSRGISGVSRLLVCPIAQTHLCHRTVGKRESVSGKCVVRDLLTTNLI